MRKRNTHHHVRTHIETHIFVKLSVKVILNFFLSFSLSIDGASAITIVPRVNCSIKGNWTATFHMSSVDLEQRFCVYRLIDWWINMQRRKERREETAISKRRRRSRRSTFHRWELIVLASKYLIHWTRRGREREREREKEREEVERRKTKPVGEAKWLMK